MSVRALAHTVIPTRVGEFDCHGYVDDDGTEHVALTMGLPADGADSGDAVLVRLHSECLTGDVLGSARCDCGQQLERALELVAGEGAGVVVYLRGHEGRGMGLVEKLRAYGLQDRGYDTVDANVELGHPVDSRDYEVGTAILGSLGVTRARLLSNNPTKRAALESAGIATSLEPLVIEPNERNHAYLDTKRERLGHVLPRFER